jgi:hypothetical protein
MRAEGLEVAVYIGPRGRAVRVGRRFDAELVMERSPAHGPGRLTFSAIEGRDVVRVELHVGPCEPGGRERHHDAVVSRTELTDEMVSGLVAALVELVFDMPAARAG